jgi:hypothetical protein
MPGAADLERVREQARSLQAAVAAGEAPAMARVAASHPVYSRPPPDHAPGWLDPQRFGLRDAQATIARELGYAGWPALVDALRPDEAGERWTPTRAAGRAGDAFRVAADRGDGHVTDYHVLLMLIDPPQPTPASAALAGLGLDRDMVERRLPPPEPGGPERGASSTPRFHEVQGLAYGLAAGFGVDEVTDDHLLLALTYHHGSCLHWLDVDPDDIAEALRSHGALIPFSPPPLPGLGSGPVGPAVYLPADSFGELRRALLDYDYDDDGGGQPGADQLNPAWGVNQSSWKPGYLVVCAARRIPLVDLANQAVDDPDEVIVMDIDDSRRLEQQQ